MKILEHAEEIRRRLLMAMGYHTHQLSGLPQTQELLDTKEASVADSEAAIK